MPGLDGPFGHPITIYYGNKQHSSMQTALFDEEDNPVDLYDVSVIRPDKAYLNSYQEYVPQKPLRYNT